jgi:hypothetical protein
MTSRFAKAIRKLEITYKRELPDKELHIWVKIFGTTPDIFAEAVNLIIDEQPEFPTIGNIMNKMGEVK